MIKDLEEDDCSLFDRYINHLFQSQGQNIQTFDTVARTHQLFSIMCTAMYQIDLKLF